MPDAGARPRHVHPRLHCRLKFFVNLHEIPGLKLCCRLIHGSAQGCQVNKGGGSTEGKRPSALYGTWQKDTLKDQVRYSAIGKRIQ